ncbi:hypothetical protein [Variovorax paradoxus]|uniref:hypothetical protein n=1 Tax=Variovorax paradoxus TaxID=34073 RepID=UPI0027827847|nr:hypothetical protein [Variovorax paradoxus]MDP9932848.1 hypothetical protein [Variovorax paradoxus]
MNLACVQLASRAPSGNLDTPLFIFKERMDRDALLKALPVWDTFQSMHRPQQRKVAEDFIEVILTAVEGDERELDEWEASNLMYACGAVAADMYSLARVAAEKALTIPAQRAPHAWPQIESTPSLAQVLAALEAVRTIDRQ